MSVFDRYTNTEQGRAFADKFLGKQPKERVNCILCSSPKRKLWYRMGDFTSWVCLRCGCRYVSPRYDDAQLDSHYSQALFTQSRDYEGLQHNMLDQAERKRKRFDMKEEISETIKRCPAGGRVLDIGCQTGIYLEALPATFKKFGVERSQWAAEYTKKITKAEINSGKVEDIEYPLEFFDVINASYVIEHLQDPLRTLNIIAGWLKKGGVFIISVPNFNSLCARLFREFYRLAEPRQHIFLTTPSSLKRVLEQLEMKVEKIYYPYFGTPYCKFSEQVRLVTNALRRFSLALLLRMNKAPQIKDLISPAFYGNIMTVVARKRS